MVAPKLRFKEFDGDWILNNIGKFLIEYKEKVPSSTEIEIYSSSREGLKPQKDYFDNRELQNFGEYGVVPPNYFTYRHMSDDTTFKFNINSIGKKIAVSKEYPVFTTNENLDSQFLLLKLNESNDFKKFAIEQKKGGTRTRLYFKALCTWETRLPSISEQTKIASFLSAVDEKISQLTQKHELLSQYKQGMMQKLFSQQIRFKADDGSEFGEWEEKELHQIFQIKAGGDIEKSSVSEVRTSEFSYPIFADADKKKGFYGWANKFKYKEAVTVTGRGNLGIAVARNEPFYPIVRLLVLLPLVKQNLKFFEEQINLLDIVSESTGVPQLTAPQLSKYKVNVPSLEEQTKIANFLSSIDQKIEVVAQQIEQAKQWKKGLLQQMFI